MMELRTAPEVIEALGGMAAVRDLTGANDTAPYNWKDSFPPKTYVVMTEALRAMGLSAPASLWRMIEAERIAS